MAHLFLNRFDVVPTLNCSHGISVTEIVKTGIRQAELDHNTLEAIVDRPVREGAASWIGEDQVVVFPFLPLHPASSVSVSFAGP